MLKIKDLSVEVEGKIIIEGLNLELEKGKTYALMGKNGSGKSTLANVIMGNPVYKVKSGEILFDGKNILEMKPDQRAKLGLFLSFQYPQEIEGVSISGFLRQAHNSLYGKEMSIFKFKEILKEKAEKLGIDEKFLERSLNSGFSGGEKKKTEILQLITLNPKLAILDETDSGLDVDAIKMVAKGVNFFKNKDKIILIITHYQRILHSIIPDKVFVMSKGKIVAQGGRELVEKIEKEGFKGF